MSTTRQDPRTGQAVERGTMEYVTVIAEEMERSVRDLRETVEELHRQVAGLKHWISPSSE